jgi:type VI secretion system protein ImpE
MIRTSRKTDWTQVSAGTYLGLGQRMYATNTGEHALMDVRRIDMKRGDGAA